MSDHEVERLQKELREHMEAWRQNNKFMASEIDRLKIALIRYGSHEKYCDKRVSASAKCICGFSDELASKVRDK